MKGKFEQRAPVAGDDLPEHCRYSDEGCELAPSCLACPFPQCADDIPGGRHALLLGRRDNEIAHLYHDQRLTIEQLAGAFRISRRTVQRVLKRTAPAFAGSGAMRAG